MVSKTYIKYFWLLNTLLDSSPLSFEDIAFLWEDSPIYDGPLPLRTFHEHRQGISEMFGVSLVEATDIYYKSETANLIEEGVSDLHCRSNKYLAEEVWNEYCEKK